jgi:hypothetical protein
VITVLFMKGSSEMKKYLQARMLSRFVIMCSKSFILGSNKLVKLEALCLCIWLRA